MEIALALTHLAVPQHHDVFFYDGDREMAAVVADYAGAGLSVGERVIVIATAPHLAAIEAALSDDGVDVSRVRAQGSYLALDAAARLASFTLDGALEVDRLTTAIDDMLDAAAVDGSRVRVFAEMVALLWQQGDVADALALESSWNGLAEQRPFSLLCAYPTSALGSAELGDVNQVCRLHSLVLPPPSYASGSARGAVAAADSASTVFVAVPVAVSAARKFVRETLTAWGEDRLVWDGALIMSELATNAIIHGGSPFRASIERDADVVRIAVEDVGPGLPQSRRMFENALGGRGVAIVEEIAHRWGCDRLAGAKVFWVELEARSTSAR